MIPCLLKKQRPFAARFQTCLQEPYMKLSPLSLQPARIRFGPRTAEGVNPGKIGRTFFTEKGQSAAELASHTRSARPHKKALQALSNDEAASEDRALLGSSLCNRPETCRNASLAEICRNAMACYRCSSGVGSSSFGAPRTRVDTPPAKCLVAASAARATGAK